MKWTNDKATQVFNQCNEIKLSILTENALYTCSSQVWFNPGHFNSLYCVGPRNVVLSHRLPHHFWQVISIFDWWSCRFINNNIHVPHNINYRYNLNKFSKSAFSGNLQRSCLGWEANMFLSTLWYRTICIRAVIEIEAYVEMYTMYLYTFLNQS